MKLLIGLGNPEPRYTNTRHNVGFTMLDAWILQHGATFRTKTKFQAEIAELTIGNQSVIVAKPTTYYNNVGESYQALSQFYQIAASNTLIVADELALPFGTVRTREGGSAAGNNGIKSIIAHHGEATKRIRIGIWNQLVAERDAADFVLSAFSAEERERLPTIEEKVLEYIEAFCDDTFEATTHQAA